MWCWKVRDATEVIVTEAEGVNELNRPQALWRRLADVLGDRITKAYLIDGAEETPRLRYQTRQRKLVETAGARIRLAETSVSVDGGRCPIAPCSNSTWTIKRNSFSRWNCPLGAGTVDGPCRRRAGESHPAAWDF